MNEATPVLDRRHLALAAAVAAEGTLTRAAQRLNLTQSAISLQLRDLEDRLGVTLFQRTTRKLHITSAGERLLAAAGPLLDQFSEVERDLRRIGAAAPVPIRISTECYTTYHWLPSLLQQLRAALPLVDAQIVLEATRRPLEALAAGRIDIAIVTAPRATPRVVFHPLFEDELLVIVPPNHALANRQWADAEHFRHEHLLTYDVPLSDLTVYREVLQPAGVRPRISRVPLTEAILEMVQAGLGITVLAEWAAAPALRSGAVRGTRLTRRGYRRHWQAATKSQKNTPKELRQFIQILARQSKTQSIPA